MWALAVARIIESTPKCTVSLSIVITLAAINFERFSKLDRYVNRVSI